MTSEFEDFPARETENESITTEAAQVDLASIVSTVTSDDDAAETAQAELASIASTVTSDDDAAEEAASAASPALPSKDALQAELGKERRRGTAWRAMRRIIFALVVIAAAAVIITTVALPILQISGSSMTETLYDQDIVVAVRGSDCQTGDVIAFYYNNKILVKRVIAKSGQWVNIDDKGNVYVDNQLLDEPYVINKARGECNIKLPYQVPENRLFVMGDHRATSVDSRSTTVGCVADEQIVGKLVFCVWPFERFGPIS